MIHTLIGQLGHLFIILSFVTSLVATWAFWKASTEDLEANLWFIFGRRLFIFHTISVVAVVVTLFLIIYNHYYEYHYAWSHSSNHLATHYMISCFWEGQEGSFLLWIFWHAMIGSFLIRKKTEWSAPVMTVFSLVQAFLVSMILGVVIPGLNLKLGSSPFILLRDALDAPIFQMNPDFVPEDGTGLNPLLQNYWMVIHPPTLFFGFALTLVPFALAIAGLWKKKFTEWIKPALPWTLLATFFLGMGIMMGAYWAYETLNFGGYWSWDPVENAVYIPWIILVACYHVMLIYKNNKTALRTSFVMVISMYMLILYSTFLTRSGILGNASVHSFTDLGLSGQLLVYLLSFLALSVGILILRWKKIPGSEKELTAYSKELWIFLGVTILCLTGFQVLIPTSIPVYNSFVGLFGVESNLAPPTEAPVYYSNFQLWFAFAIAILSSVGQYFWWKNIKKGEFLRHFSMPIVVTLILTSIVILVTKVVEVPYILLLTAGIFSVVANGSVAILLLKRFELSGGAISHLGMALVILGILYSAGYSHVISMNNTGLLIFRDASDVENQENLVLWLNDRQPMAGYQVTYKGQRIDVKGVSEYVDKEALRLTEDPYQVVAIKDYHIGEKHAFKRGDTLTIEPENTYYEVLYESPNGDSFTLFPRVQTNPSMGTVFSPDIRVALTHDLYTYASAVTDPADDVEWSEAESVEVKAGKQFFINDYVAILDGVEPITQLPGVTLIDGDIAVQAQIRLLTNSEDTVRLQPTIVIKGENGARLPAINRPLGINLRFMGVDPTTETFKFEYQTTQKDYIVLKAIKKPWINILWLGTFITLFGLFIAIRRRFKEAKRA